jgi:transposase
VTLKTLDKRYAEKYGLSLVENLKYIQRNGVEEVLKNEKKRWKCPTCSGVICVHNKKCYICSAR